jgi:serine/threonine-protein kinase
MEEFVARVRGITLPEYDNSEDVKTASVWFSKERSSLKPKTLHETFIQRVLSRLQPDGELFHAKIGEGHPLPVCSADYGTAGIAYGLLRLACNRDDPKLLSLSDLWISKTLDHAQEESAFYNEKLELTKETVSEISLHHMVNGVYFVRALVSHAFGDPVTEQAAIEAFVMASQVETDNLDITLGRSSVLHGCSLLVEKSRNSRNLDLTSLREFGDHVMDGIWKEVSEFAPLHKSQEMSFLGMAHGWAGVLFATLRWCRLRAELDKVEVSTLLHENVSHRLTELAQWGLPAGRGLVWSWQNELGGDFASGNNGFMPGWCNGNAGHVFLWTEAYKVFGEQRYLELARKAAWGVWEQPSSFNNLCCGATGSAYAMLNLYRVTEDKDWLMRARQYAHRVVTTEEPPSEHETDVNSLYKGEIGAMVLLDDLVDPKAARMPLFE